MTTWYDVIEPHDDIKQGEFDEAIFAAKLGDVALGKAVVDYNEPSLFFKKTYFTDGINNLLQMVQRKLKTGKGSSVVEIKTPFGGGKTHALIAIYHYIQNGNKVKHLLPEHLEPTKADVAVIVGTQLNPLEGHDREDIHINTLWGEIAYQLAGKKGYQTFEQNDKNKIAPGKEKLREFFENQGPFTILCDEVLQYITKARGVKYHDTNLASQTLAFLQELTETISSLHHGMLVVTLPSSYLEDYTDKEEESLAKLEKVFGRIESIETPVKGEEIYSIIQRRLFSSEINTQQKEEIILSYFKKYQKEKDDLPNKAKEMDYKRKMNLAYPFHPEVIDVLYEKWGTFSSFQRTRGVLRLLANVIEDLYNREVNIDIILPSDLKLGTESVRQEFIKHVGSEYESIIGSDISGHEAKAIQLDKENKGWKHLAERISTAIFFYSFSGDKSKKGINLEYIKFAVLHKETITPMITEVLQRLNKNLWYLNQRGDMYRFSKIPNLNRMILDKKELYNETYTDTMKQILQKETGNAFHTLLWPKKSENIPDNKEIKLIILKPEETIDTPKKWLEKKGNTFRTYKNTLIFALADPSGYGSFKEEIKTMLALKEIQQEIKNDKETGLSEKQEEITERIKRINDDISYNVRRMYNTLLIGDEKLSLGQPSVGKESLSNWYKTELISQEKIASNIHYRFILSKFMQDKKQLETKIILDQFYKDPSFVIPTSEKVIKQSIQQGIVEGAFGLGYTKEDNNEIDNDSLKYKSNIPTNIISCDEGEYLLSKEYATELVSEQKIEEEESGSESTKPESTSGTEGDGDEGTKYPREPTKGEEQIKDKEKRLKKINLRIEDIPSSKIADFSRGVLIPISREIGAFTFHMEIHIEHGEGIPEKTMNDKIKETISQIGAKITKDESE